ncbi:Ubiquitin-conjugating enzyme [Carpediemonas membranifera]|uniref:E2 ubiquitin-conjugating enzyme n=1 Tax=Carpediemonas membranifera TaxID=201153 RepID=A0A8J6B3N7_9EUKA|nr:Ubiquitin-conjugating enzyme [Carpediemonas membranifera]|eukprot:KAG9393619.1 Ubiquitin-conjugating enzyme [Carpediemonas membranifera]
MSFSQAATILAKQLRELQRENAVEGISVGLIDDSNIFEWQVIISGPSDTDYEGGIFKAILKFPHDFPLNPPKMKFISEMYHPNIYPDGDVCISILHAPGDDPMHYETADERWRPVHGVQSVLLSVVSMLNEPNTESPANIEAAKLSRENMGEFKKRVRRTVRRSLESL